ncbi:MAG: hypothetical protein WCT03_12120 [Candidatus Obscuribacterales bacterium]|jgi:hypothetical protein
MNQVRHERLEGSQLDRSEFSVFNKFFAADRVINLSTLLVAATGLLVILLLGVLAYLVAPRPFF